MKKKLLIATGILLAGIVNAQSTFSLSLSINTYRCQRRIDVFPIGGIPGHYIEVKETATNTVVYSSNQVYWGGSVLIPVNPLLSNIYTQYTVTATDYQNPTNVATGTISTKKACFIKEPVLGPGGTHRTFIPDEDPDGEELETMEIKWMLEQLNSTTLEPEFTVSDPVNWAPYNVGWASNPMKGFDGFHPAASIAALQAGDYSSTLGIFDPEKIYRITRSYRFAADDDWAEHSVYIGPGYDDEQRGTFFDVFDAPVELFSVAQDRDQQTVTFLTDVDEGTLEICDAAGNRITPITLQNEEFSYELQTANLAKGLYIAQLQSHGFVTAKKFIIE